MLDEQRQQHLVDQRLRADRHELAVRTLLYLVLGGITLVGGRWLTTAWLAWSEWLAFLSRSLFTVGGSAVLAFGAMDFYSCYRRISRTANEAAKEAYLGRSGLREEIRWWVAHLELEFSWLLNTTTEKQRDWAIRRFREIITLWPTDHRRFECLQQHEEFEQAMAEVGAPGLRMLEIWRSRTSLYQWARSDVTAVERVLGGLDTQEEIARAKVERLDSFEAFRARRDESDDTLATAKADAES